MLIGLLGDPAAPLCVIRLWGHCQQQKTHRFPRLSAEALKAICFFPGDAGALWLAFQTSEFIKLDGETVVVHQWDEYNSSLVAAWDNGAKGGRPKTHSKPSDNPRVTHGVTDREEKIEKNKPPPALRARDELFDALASATGNDPKGMTSSAAKSCGVKLAEIRKASPDVTPAEINRRAKLYRDKYRDAALTPAGLCAHWGEFATKLNGGGVSRPDPYKEPDFDWRSVARRVYPDAMDWISPHDFSKIAWSVIDLNQRSKILQMA